MTTITQIFRLTFNHYKVNVAGQRPVIQEILLTDKALEALSDFIRNRLKNEKIRNSQEVSLLKTQLRRISKRPRTDNNVFKEEKISKEIKELKDGFELNLLQLAHKESGQWVESFIKSYINDIGLGLEKPKGVVYPLKEFELRHGLRTIYDF